MFLGIPNHQYPTGSTFIQYLCPNIFGLCTPPGTKLSILFLFLFWTLKKSFFFLTKQSFWMPSNLSTFLVIFQEKSTYEEFAIIKNKSKSIKRKKTIPLNDSAYKRFGKTRPSNYLFNIKAKSFDKQKYYQNYLFSCKNIPSHF